MRNIILIFFIFLLIGTGSPVVCGEPLESASFPSLISTIKIKTSVDFCGEPVPLNDPEIYERLEKELLLFAWNRSQVILWLKRTGRYMPYIEKMLEKHGMPDDLKYSAVVESSLIPYIRSSKYATGLWQFIKATGIRYGLRIDSHIDERRNVYKATEAAIMYLKKLYGDFNSWTLAVAAYNMGEAGLRSKIDFQNTRDFYHLYLPMETQRHILKIVAVKLLLSNPEKYGFHFEKSDFYSLKPFDTVRVESSGRVPLTLIAEAAQTYYKTVRNLNPEIRNRYLPAGSYSLAVPEGAALKFQERYQRILSEREAKAKSRPAVKKKKGPRIYVVKRGDNLSRIAEKFRVPMSRIIKWNKLRTKTVYPGQRLIVGR